MKIMMMVPYFWPKVGGLEKYAEAIALGLVKNGHEVHIITSGSTNNTGVYRGMTIHQLKTLFTISNTPYSPFWPAQIKKLVNTINPDIINAHAPVPTMALACIKAAKNKPVIITYHAGSMAKGKLLPDVAIGYYEKFLLPKLLNRADHIICASSFVKDNFLGEWSDKCSIITPGVDTQLFTPAVKRRLSRQILFVGDYRDPRKGLDYAIKAVQDIPGTMLSVIGPGPAQNIPQVRFLGIKSSTQIADQMQKSDCLILPSTSQAESFGMVLLEAMATGTPVIGSNIGGIPTVINDGVDGILTKPASTESLTVALRHILSDPKLAARMGIKGYQKAQKHFNWKERIAATERIFKAASTKKPAVLLMHNVVAPYRLPVFEEVANKSNLLVLFCKAKTKDRLWDANLAGYGFKRKVLPSFKIGPFYINLTIIWHLLTNPYEVYVVGDFPEMLFAIITITLVAKLRHKPLVLWSETIDNQVNYYQDLAIAKNPLAKLIRTSLQAIITGYRRILFGQATSYIALSKMAKSFLVSQGINPRRITSGIQVMPAQLLASPSLKLVKTYNGQKIVLYLGYLNPLKNIDQLILAVKQIADPSIRLLIVGSGPAETSLRKIAQGDRRIKFLGYLDGQKKTDILQISNVLVLPTLADCWGLVVNEALYYGKPVITTSLAGASELLRLKSSMGQVIAPNNIDILSKAIEQTLGQDYRSHIQSADYLRLKHMISDPILGARPILRAITKAGERS